MAGASEKRVLVVEDEGDLRASLASRLREKGLSVDEAEGGRQAMHLLAAQTYTVILVDLVMPQPDGFAVLDAISAGTLKVPSVVLVTAGEEPAVLERLDPDRIHGVVRKPFDAEELADLVLACAEIRSRSSLGVVGSR
ncbi:MAG: response regulator [Thermoanaerobaculia bacterium]